MGKPIGLSGKSRFKYIPGSQDYHGKRSVTKYELREQLLDNWNADVHGSVSTEVIRSCAVWRSLDRIPTSIGVPRWPCELGAWLITRRSRVRGWVAAACRLFAVRPRQAELLVKFMLRPTQPATNWTANESHRAVVTVTVKVETSGAEEKTELKIICSKTN